MSKGRSAEGRKGVDAYTKAELHQLLVSDAVKSHATELPWMMAALKRIGGTAEGMEAAYQAVVAEKAALTGSHMMPVAAATPAELRALGL